MSSKNRESMMVEVEKSPIFAMSDNEALFFQLVQGPDLGYEVRRVSNNKSGCMAFPTKETVCKTRDRNDAYDIFNRRIFNAKQKAEAIYQW